MYIVQDPTELKQEVNKNHGYIDRYAEVGSA